jgi:hypothetical protein
VTRFQEERIALRIAYAHIYRERTIAEITECPLENVPTRTRNRKVVDARKVVPSREVRIVARTNQHISRRVIRSVKNKVATVGAGLIACSSR